MLDFPTQKKILEPILKDPKNQHCADCNAVSPTWASLDFGVFLCSNCSGAHRGLGPTITRVRSANLDKWQHEWLSNMQIGNTQLNRYWQSDPMAFERKPTAGADLNLIGRYVFEKYIKRKFVKDRNMPDPLTLYKQGHQLSKEPAPKQTQSKEMPKVQLVPTPPLSASKSLSSQPKKEVCLLDFDFEDKPKHTQIDDKRSLPNRSPPKATLDLIEQQDFTQFAQAGSTKSEKAIENTDLIDFDTLLSQQKQQQVEQQQQIQHSFNSYDGIRNQNMQLHHPYNPHIAHHNLVYQNQYQQPISHNRHHYSLPHAQQQFMMGQGQGPISVMPQPSFW